jgi:catechol 2,3-dioxygenase-like lactoylglutathione lyase family enzyme
MRRSWSAYQRLLYLSPHCISCEGPQRLPVASGGVVAFKFRDPDGHPLELIGFPPGMGNARWHGRGRSGATIGIDHFALSVSAIEQSIAFYQRTFGFNIDARQVNSGPEQGRLDGLKAPIVEIVAMSSGESDTPHLELLAYRQPSARTYDHCLVDNVVDCLIFERTATFVDELASRLDTDPDCHVFKVDCPSRPLYES